MSGGRGIDVYSALYTGEASARDDSIGVLAEPWPPDASAPVYHGAPSCPGIDVVGLHDACGYSDATCCPGLTCVDRTDDGYGNPSCEFP